MTDDSALRESLRRAASAMPPNAERPAQVVRRASRGRTVRVAVAGVGVGATAVVVALIAGAVRSPTPVPPAGPSFAVRDPIPFVRARAVPDGIRIEFVGADPSLPPSSPCRMAYSADTAPGAAGELRVTVLARPDTTATGKAEVACESKGFARSLDVPVDRPYAAVVDTVSGTRHPVEPAPSG